MHSLRIFLFLLTSGLLLTAQTPTNPDIGQRHREDLRKSYRVEQRIEHARESFGGVHIESPQTPLPDAAGLSDEKILLLERVELDPLPKAISVERLRSVVDGYVGTKVSMRDLYAMLGAIDDLYDRVGVLGRAVLPVQDIQQGVVKIQLIEARVGSYEIRGGRRLRDWYLHRTVASDKGSFIRLRAMERKLIRYNMAHDSKLRAELVSGAAFGETDVVLHVEEPPVLTVASFADNSGRKATGRLRAGFSVTSRSQFGFDETLTLSGDHSDGWDGLGVQYSQPVTPWGTFASLGVDWSRYKIIDGEAESLKVDGDSKAYSVGISQVLLAGPSWSLRANAGLSLGKTGTRFEKARLFGEETLLGSLGLSFWLQDKTGFWELVQSGFYADEREGETGHFKFCSGSLMRVQWFGQNWTAVARGTWQFVEGEIISSQQFQIGGTATVRGFEEGLLFGEDGCTGTLELRRSLIRSERGSLEALAFADHGSVYNGDSGLYSWRQLSSCGFGLNVSFAKRFAARLAFARPIGRYSDLDGVDTPSRGRLHFSVQAVF